MSEEYALRDYFVESYRQVFDRLRLLSDFNLGHHWCDVAKRHNMSMWRVITPVDLPESRSHVSKFIRESGPSIIYPLMFSGQLFGFGFRGLEEKGFRVITKCPLYFYSSHNVLRGNYNLSYGSTWIFSEGSLDAEAVSLLYPNLPSFSYQTNSISDAQAQFISMFTDNIILVPDTDVAGERGLKKTIKNLNHYGITYQVVNIESKWKDPGDLLLASHAGENVSLFQLELDLITKESRNAQV